MNPALWQQARQLYETVCDLPINQQQAALENCDLSSEAVGLAQRMLTAERTQRLAKQLGDQAPTITASISTTGREGKQLGPYQIDTLLARGGMGEIYRAERTDGTYRQRVAIKFVTPTTTDAAARFERERQLLASLEHPNIARLLDGGTASDGMPYLVMEYIDGMPIDHYCDQHRLNIEQRLRLFLKVIDGVSAAHRQLIIHRDLKPTNVLVDDDGQPKLIDFGIGKSLTLDPTNSVMTLADQTLLTPNYAAPEQISNGQVGTHTDSFQLGLLLDELVSGLSARELSDLSMQQVVSRCLEPIKPAQQRVKACGQAGEIAEARSCSKAALIRLLQSDLAQILGKANATDPKLRYRHVDDLGDDIRAFLAQRPVAARPASRAYFIGKFIRRHRVSVTATSFGLVALIGSLVVSVQQARNAQQQSALAQAESTKQRQVTNFLLSIFRNADPNVSQGREVSAQSLLARAGSLVEDQVTDRATVAAIKQAMGGAYLGLGIIDEAEPFLQEALTIYRETGRASTEDFAATAYLLGELHQAAARDSALEYHQLALETRVTLSEASRPELTDSLLATSRALRKTHDHQRIVSTYQRALVSIESYAGKDSPDYASALGELGAYYGSVGQFDQAFATAVEAHQLGEKTMTKNNPKLAALAMLLGTVASDTGRFAIAEQHLGNALSMFGSIYDERHPRTLSALANLSALNGNQGNLDAHIALSTTYKNRLVEVFGDDSPKTAYGWQHLGRAYFAAERYEQALTAHRTAEEIYRRTPGSNSGARDQLLQARALLKLGQPRLAQQHIAIGRTRGVTLDTSVMANQFEAEALLVLGQTSAALALAEAALVEATDLKQSLLQAQTTELLARIHMAAGRSEKATEYLRLAAAKLTDDPTHQAIQLTQKISFQLEALKST